MRSQLNQSNIGYDGKIGANHTWGIDADCASPTKNFKNVQRHADNIGNVACFFISLNMETRASFLIPFLDKSPIENLNGSRLPTCCDIFCHYWHCWKVLGQTIKDAQRSTAKAVIACWESVCLAPKTIINIIKDIRMMVTQFRVIVALDSFLRALSKAIVKLLSNNHCKDQPLNQGI